MPGHDVHAVAVVVPARDEELVLPACLRSLDAARSPLARLGVPVLVVVLADSCRDRTAEVARAHSGVEVLETRAGTAGAARAAGVDGALRMHATVPADRVWVASTDADSVVPPDWLSTQVDLAGRDHDAVAGLVALDGVGHRLASERWRAAYDLACRRHLAHHRAHGRVHGANLGVRADAYRAAGGFAPVRSGEDVGLVDRLRAAGRAVAWPLNPVVVTSARLHARSAAGVAADLRALV